MISFNYETDLKLDNEDHLEGWLSKVITMEGCVEGEINYIFCSDDYLLDINRNYLNHDTYTDIISFDYSVGKELHGDIYISIDRVKENAVTYNSGFDNELARVMVHGILHYCGYKDKSELDNKKMREREDFHLSAIF